MDSKFDQNNALYIIRDSGDFAFDFANRPNLDYVVVKS